jgi:hypothetical protein
LPDFKKSDIKFPYYELYGKGKLHGTQKPDQRLDPKQMLMKRVRTRFQSLENPHKHEITLRKFQIEALIPKIRENFTIKGRDLSPKRIFRVNRKEYSKSITPSVKKKHLLFFRMEKNKNFDDII